VDYLPETPQPHHEHCLGALPEPSNGPARRATGETTGGQRGGRAARTTVETVELLSPEAAARQLRDLHLAVEGLLHSATADATDRAHRSDLTAFTEYCALHGLDALPASPDTVALYIAARVAAGDKVATIRRRLASISVAHQAAGVRDSPTRSALVRTAMRGAARQLGTAPSQATPLRLATLRRLLEETPEDTTTGVRDRAILLLGFAGALRRSELSALDLGDLREEDEGLVVTIRRSKTDPEGAGRQLGIPRGRNKDTCPVRATLRWIHVAGIADGPLFRRIGRWDALPAGRLGDRSIALVVQRAADRAGLEPTDYAGHSLRSGFATEAAAQGVPERAIMAQTGHRSVAVLRGYIRSGSLWRENAASSVGL
jgi:site-specific recombinase XerD